MPVSTSATAAAPGLPPAHAAAPAFDNQRPPAPRPPPHALRRMRAERRDIALARALGWFSLGVGAAALAAPAAVQRTIGTGHHATWTRAVGVREVVAGIGLFGGRAPALWLWARVAGDLLDLALLGAALRERRARRGRLLAAAGAVTAATALDLYAARRWSGRELPRTPAASALRTATCTIAINRPPQLCYDAWHRFEDLPRFMHHLEAVTTLRPGVTHWVAKAPFGRVEWDAEVTSDQPGQLIAWRSVDAADVEQAGVVRFTPGPRNGCIASVEMRYRMPGGSLGAALAKVFGDDPQQAVREDLRRFKRLLETGEIATTAGQPHGRRGLFHPLLRKVHAR